MSHLSILPTVLRDTEILAAALVDLGYQPMHGGALPDFGGALHPVDLLVQLPTVGCIGWRRQADGSLALVGDLQRLSRSHQVPALLGRITHAYAAHQALSDASVHLPQAFVTLRR